MYGIICFLSSHCISVRIPYSYQIRTDIPVSPPEHLVEAHGSLAIVTLLFCHCLAFLPVLGFIKQDQNRKERIKHIHVCMYLSFQTCLSVVLCCVCVVCTQLFQKRMTMLSLLFLLLKVQAFSTKKRNVWSQLFMMYVTWDL